MKNPQDRHLTFEEFEELRNQSEDRLEYVNGVVYITPSPSTQHQRISMKLSAKLFSLLEGTDCVVIAAPYDIELSGNESDDVKIVVIPDLSVICDKKGFTKQKYVGVPDLIIEILSPSHQAHDLIFKTNLYQANGVKEYWIVNPILHHIMVYTLDDSNQYRLAANEKQGMVRSNIIEGFEVDVEKMFD
ncbi:Uma2 family endonuclease [Siminovitchia sediminis]|uniref:Uma2 family endonuclease n=1 Tax=Siminovitchia sediminis TaxID=1274353 RepID=A0ABW4KIS3_9BACI